jgi:iron complex outermembrane recepter protein
MHVSYRGLLAALILCIGRTAGAQQETPGTPTPSNPQDQAPAAATGSPVASEPVTEAAGKRSATEEIVVTGSRIRRKDLTTPAPVTVISRDQVLASGKISIGDFLQTLPEQGNATNTSVNNAGDGTVNVALRSLGSNRTLVLIDGKRMVFGAGGNTLPSSVDLNAIPTNAIERVEILKDGASSVYGSDAIAGVVNIITRKKANGTEVSGYTGTSTRGGGTTYDVGLTTGASGDVGNFIFTGGYFNQNEIFAGQRGWAQRAVGYNFRNGKERQQGSYRVPSGNFGLTDLDGNPCGIKGLNLNDPNLVLPAQSDPRVQKCVDILNGFGDPTGSNVYLFTPGTSGAINGFVPYTGGNQSYNFQPVNYLVTPSQRITLFANGDTRLGEIGRAYMQASFVNRQSSIQLAPVPFDTSLYNLPIGLAVSKDNIYNPFGFDVGLAARRMLELNGRNWASDVDTYHAVAGIDGTLPEIAGPAQGFFWDVSFNYGRTNTQYISHNTLRTTKIADAIGPSFTDATGPHCGTPGNVINGCVPLNLFGGPNTVTQAMLDPLTYQGDNQMVNQLAAVEATASGELFSLAASRPAGIALGYQFRREFGLSLPNPITAAFEDSDNNFGKTEGSFNVHEAYAELSVPLISDVPFAEQLEVDVAGRYSHYNTFGGKGTYKFGGRWRPIRDVTIRGTYSTGFRAPSISELYSGNTQSAEATQGDPCSSPTSPAAVAGQCGTAAGNGDPNTQINSIIGGSPRLQPETSKMYTIGVVLEPSMVRNLSVTVDYYNISIDSLITAYGLDFILNKCYPGPTGASDPAFCSLITRNANHRIVQVIDTNVNIGGQDTSGVDVALRYALPTDYGRFGFLFDSNILIKNDQTVPSTTGGLRTIHFKSTYDQIGTGAFGGVNPIFKANAGVTYGLGGFSGAVSGRYIGPYWECAGANGRSVGFCYQQNPENSLHRLVSQYVVFDLFASYALQSDFGRTTLSAGINNVLNTNPPRVYDNSFTFSDPSAYDYIGRFVYGRLTQRF